MAAAGVARQEAEGVDSGDDGGREFSGQDAECVGDGAGHRS